MKKIPDTISIHIEWSIEDDAYIARCKEFPLLATHGDTLQKTYDEMFFVLNESMKWLIEEEEVTNSTNNKTAKHI